MTLGGVLEIMPVITGETSQMRYNGDNGARAYKSGKLEISRGICYMEDRKGGIMSESVEATEGKPVDPKAETLGRNQSVTRPIPRISIDVIPTKAGRQRRMTPRKMMNGINKYFEHCETTDDLPSIKGMMIHMKFYREDFYRYMKDQRYADMLEHARLIIEHWAERAVWESNGMAAGKIAYMKNVHSWAEKVDTHNVTEVRKISVEEATSKIKMLAPLLLDVLNRKHVVDQMAQPVEDAVLVEVDSNESGAAVNGETSRL